MKSLIILAIAVIAVVSAGSLEELKASLAKLNIPEERLAKYKAALEQYGKPCIREVTKDVPPEKVSAKMQKIVPLVDSCVEKVKDIPLDQVDERKKQFKECLNEKYDALESGLPDEEKAGLKAVRGCIEDALKQAKKELGEA